jgi:hypothetical protein
MWITVGTSTGGMAAGKPVAFELGPKSLNSC